MIPVATTTANWKWDLSTIPVKNLPSQLAASQMIPVKMIDVEQHV